MIPQAGTPVAHVAQTLGPPSDLHKCPVAQALPEIFWAKGTKPQVRGGGPWPTPTGRARAHTHAPARPREAVPSATRKGTEMQQAIPSPEGVVSILLDNGEIIDIGHPLTRHPTSDDTNPMTATTERTHPMNTDHQPQQPPTRDDDNGQIAPESARPATPEAGESR